MTDFASHLKRMFDSEMSDRLEAYWVLPDGKSIKYSDEDDRAIDIFKILLATLDAIPSSLMTAAGELRATEPARFENALWRGLGSVGYGFSPADATEFVEELNRIVQSDVPIADRREQVLRLASLAATIGK
jgi:hypothetical protein